MARFKQLNVKGFRRLLDVDIPLRPLTVMIGVNGVGKSSILEVLSLLSCSAEGKLRATITSMGGLGSMMTLDRADSLTLGTKMDVAGHEPLEYELRLEPRGPAYVIEHEVLCQHRLGYSQPFVTTYPLIPTRR
jgi:predicted ATPase